MEYLKDKNYRSYDYISRYQKFPYYFHKQDNRYIYGVTSQLNTNIGYSLHIVKQGDTLDSIALDYYNSPSYYWIICDFNQIQNPYVKLKVGDKIKVPVLSSITYKQEK